MRHGTRLAVALALPALALGACGDGTTDQDAITKIIKDGARDPLTVCEHLSDTLLRRFGSTDACRRQARGDAERAKGAPGEVTIDRLQVTGDAATARITGRDGPGTISFVKDSGSWKINDTTGGAR